MILGSSGMLGQAIAREGERSALQVVPISRSATPSFDLLTQPLKMFTEGLNLGPSDWIVNCIGWIPQKSSGNETVDKTVAHALNASLPRQIAELQASHGFQWLQIGTDCVFSGIAGNYSEASPYDPIDLYGISKAAGEAFMSGAFLVRASIVGPDNRSAAGLYEWFRSQKYSASVRGYTNHFWNGVTTLSFAKLVIGVVQSSFVSPLRLHWIPRDIVSKYELLQLFKMSLEWSTPHIEPVSTNSTVNRSLTTLDSHRNAELWKIAGYDGIPTVEELVSEMVSESLE